MARFIVGFGIPRDMIVREPECYKPAHSDRNCERPGCNKKIKAWTGMRWTPGRKGYEHPFHLQEDERKAIDNGLVVAPKDKHGHRNLYLVFLGKSLLMRRVDVAQVGFIVAIGTALGMIDASRVSFQDENGE